METIDDFHSMNQFLTEQIHCRRMQKRNSQEALKDPRESLKDLSFKSINSYHPLEDLQLRNEDSSPQIMIASKVSLKKIQQRVKRYIKQYKNLSRDIKIAHLYEVSIIKIQFKKVLSSDHNLYRGKRKFINNTIYRSFFKINISHIEKCIKKTFYNVPHLKSLVTFDLALPLQEETLQQDFRSQDVLNNTSNFISAELNKIVFKKFKLLYNPLKYDVEEAIECALQDNKGTSFSLAIKIYLLQIIEEKYSPVNEFFTLEQLRDAEFQLRKKHFHAMLRDGRQNEHDYVEYDEKSLYEAIRTTHSTSISSQGIELGKPLYAPVVRYRMPGFKANQSDYEQLKTATITFLESPSVMKRLEDVLPLLSEQIAQTETTESTEGLQKEDLEIEIKTPE